MSSTPDLLEICRRMAGDQFSKLQSTLQDTVELLDHRRPEVRAAALMMLGSYWKPTGRFLMILKRVLAIDPDEQVRCLAAQTLGLLFEGHEDSTAAYCLATVIASDTESPKVRWAAYQALACLAQVELTRLADVVLSGDPDSIDEVDWNFVRQFLQ